MKEILICQNDNPILLENKNFSVDFYYKRNKKSYFPYIVLPKKLLYEFSCFQDDKKPITIEKIDTYNLHLIPVISILTRGEYGGEVSSNVFKKGKEELSKNKQVNVQINFILNTPEYKTKIGIIEDNENYYINFSDLLNEFINNFEFVKINSSLKFFPQYDLYLFCYSSLFMNFFIKLKDRI